MCSKCEDTLKQSYTRGVGAKLIKYLNAVSAELLCNQCRHTLIHSCRLCSDCLVTAVASTA